MVEKQATTIFKKALGGMTANEVEQGIVMLDSLYKRAENKQERRLIGDYLKSLTEQKELLLILD